MTNAFNWKGPSTILDKMGRIKTDRQTLLDALRVNTDSRDYSSQASKDRTLSIVGKAQFQGRNP